MIPLSKRRTLSLQPTQQCNAACEHCGTFSSPTTRTKLKKDVALDAIRQAADCNFTHVAFSGGEPTLTGRWLLEAIALATALGLKTQIVTNGWWAKTRTAAERRLRNLVDAGLNEIDFSTGDQHAKYVPVERVVRGACISVEINLPATIIVELVQERTITKQVLEKSQEVSEIRAKFPDRQLNIFQSPWMSLDPSDVQSYPDGVLANRENLGSRGGCDDVIQTMTVSPDGMISACCGIGMRLIPELQLGSAYDVTFEEAVSNAENNPILWRLRNVGPEALLELASRKDASIVWENMYAHRCQACIRLFTDSAARRILSDDVSEPRTGPSNRVSTETAQ